MMHYMDMVDLITLKSHQVEAINTLTVCFTYVVYPFTSI